MHMNQVRCLLSMHCNSSTPGKRTSQSHSVYYKVPGVQFSDVDEKTLCGEIEQLGEGGVDRPIRYCS